MILLYIRLMLIFKLLDIAIQITVKNVGVSINYYNIKDTFRFQVIT